MKTVITYGTFDLFHVGHVKLLQRLRNLGDRLVVGCSTDEFNSIKGKNSVVPFEHRKEILLSCRYVDSVFPENSWDQKPSDITKFKANIFAMGSDWSGKFDYLKDFCDVVYLPRTEDVSSTEIRQVISALEQERLGEIKTIVSHLSAIVNKI